MSAQPLLLDVPYWPSPDLIRRQAEAAALERIKAHFWILTHHNADCSPPWLAVAVDRGETRNIGQIMSEECRYLEETGRTEEADTEADAVLGLVRRTHPGFDFQTWQAMEDRRAVA